MVPANVLYHIQCVQTCSFYLNRERNSFLGKPGRLQSPCYVWVCAQVSTLLGFPQPRLREAVACLQAAVFSVACIEFGVFVTNALKGELPPGSFWRMALIPITPTEMLFIVDWCLISCLGGTKGGVSYVATMLMSFLLLNILDVSWINIVLWLGFTFVNSCCQFKLTNKLKYCHWLWLWYILICII